MRKSCEAAGVVPVLNDEFGRHAGMVARYALAEGEPSSNSLQLSSPLLYRMSSIRLIPP